MTVQFVDRRATGHENGSLAAFYPATELYNTFEIATRHPAGDVYPLNCAEMFTHGYLVYGSVSLENTTLRPATIANLNAAGFLKLLPKLRKAKVFDFSTPGQYRRSAFSGFEDGGSATSQRRSGNCTQAMTRDLLTRARKVALCFAQTTRERQQGDAEPSPAIFLHFLSFARRRHNDAAFIRWITSRYAGKHLPRFTPSY